jgi:FLVCR family feline leukemia virus subgroup C receptor-related protein
LHEKWLDTIDRVSEVHTVFQSAPKLPPSPAQAVQRNTVSVPFATSIKHLVTNPGYMLLLVSYGINVGVFYAISTLLNQIVLAYFPVSI